jgi:hypothetical protein
MKHHEITINYKEEEGSVNVELDTDGVSPYTLIGIFEHFIGKIKNRLDSTNSSFPDKD